MFEYACDNFIHRRLTTFSQVEAEIEAFGGVDNVYVEQSTNTSLDDYDLHRYKVTFLGQAVAGDVPQLRVVDIGENGCGAITNSTAGLEVQETLVDSFIPLYKVQNTADLAYDAPAADVKAAIETLTGACTAGVSRSVMGNGYEWLVTFSGAGGDGTGNDPLLRAMRPNAIFLDNLAEYVEPEANIVPILQAELSTPKSGVPYYVRAAATNVVGTGAFRTSSPTSLQPAAQPPTVPTYAKVRHVSDTELMVQWQAPLSDGGKTVTEYAVEWDTATTFDSGTDGNPQGSTAVDASERGSVADVQAVRVSIDDGLFISGSFSMEYNGQVTGSIPFDASAVEVKGALESLCTVSDVAVTRSLGPANGGYTWLVTMVTAPTGGELGDGRVSTTSALQTIASHKLQVNGQNLLACADSTRSGCWSDPSRTSAELETRREVQRLLCQPANEFNITFMGETTGALSSDANATEIEDALEALYNVGDVTVTGACGGVSAADSFVYVVFENDGGDLPVLSSSLEGDFEEVTRGSVQIVVGQKPFSFVISDITSTAATPWTVRVSAYNSVGYGDFTVATHDSKEMVAGAVGAPSLPENLAVEVASARSAWVYWDAPASDGGDSITSYVVEVDTSDGFDSVCGDGPEVQTLTMSSDNATHAGEKFNLTIGDFQHLTCLDWNTGVFAVQDGLRSAVGGALDNVVVTRGGDGTSAWAYGYTYSITFVHNTTNTGLANFPKMEAASCGTGSDDVTFEVKTVRDGTGTMASACQAENLLPVESNSVLATEAEGAGESSLREFGYLVTGLAPGTSYRVRVAAVNSMARSPWSFLGYPGRPTTFSPSAVPRIARNITVTPGMYPGQVHVGIGLPVGIDVSGAEGLPLQGFRVEMAKRVFEAQVVAVTFAWDATGSGIAYPTQGSYTLTVGNSSTWCLEWDAPAEDIELALDSLATVDGVTVEALQPDLNSTSNGTTSEYSTRPMLVSFTGPHLSNGDQDLIDFSICTMLDAGAYVDVYTVADGVAGTVSPSVTVSTSVADESGSSGTTVSGSYLVSFGYRGDLGLRLGEGNETSVYVTMEAGSRTVQSASDLSHYVNEGDVIEVGGVQLVIAGDFVCEDVVAWDNTLAAYPCSFAVEFPHPSGVQDVPAYGASNSLGSVHVQNGDTTVLTNWDLTPFLSAGDLITVRDPASGEYFQSDVLSLDGSSVTLEAGYEGPSAVRASAFFSPYAVVPFDASAEEVRDAIESLPSVGSVEVAREGPDKGFGFEWSVTLTSFDGPLSGAHTLRFSSSTSKALEVAGCGEAGNGTYAATGEMVDGRMRYKLIDRPSYIQYDSSADAGRGRWVVVADGAEEPYVQAVIGPDAPARDSLVPPTGSVSYWTTPSCNVSIPSSPVELLEGVVSSEELEIGVMSSFNELAKDVSTEPGVSEVQEIQLGATSDALDGTFLVDFADAGGFTAAWDISASDMEVRVSVDENLKRSFCTFETCFTRTE